MTDAAIEDRFKVSKRFDWSSEAHARRVKRRYAANRRLQFYGLCAIALAIGLLGILIGSLIVNGYKSFYQTKASLQVLLDPGVIDKDNIDRANYRRLFNNALEQYFPDVKDRTEKRQLADLFSSEARYALRNFVRQNPDKIGQTIAIDVPLSDPFDQLEKSVIPRYVEAFTGTEKERFEYLQNQGLFDSSGAGPAIKLNLFIDPQG